MLNLLKKLILFLFFGALLVFLVLFLLLRYPTPAPAIHPSFAPKPDLDHLPPLKVTFIPNGTSTAWQPFIFTGGEVDQEVKMVFGSFLVQHPKGTFLIDGGLSSTIQQEMTEAPWYLRKLYFLDLGKTMAQQKDDYPALNNVQFILLTHSHWDHISGAKDFPNVPIYLLPEEIDFMQKYKESFLPVVFLSHRKDLQDRFRPIALKGRPYEIFSNSLDWFGDQSVVLVPLPGHTPGSLGIFLNVSPTERYLVVGDALWTVDDAGRPQARSVLAEWFADNDADQARHTRAELDALWQNSNDITLVPVHDQEVLEKLKAKGH